MKLAWSFTRVFFGSTISLVAFGCAQGSSLDIGIGGAGGASDGSSRPTTSHTGQGSSSGLATSGGTTSGPTTSGTPSSSGALASSGNATSSANVATVASVAASSSSGGPTTCDPMNPTSGCTSADHCLPTTTGTPTCTPPVGAGAQYSACVGRQECAGPYECVDTGDLANAFCCLAWCTGDGDCAGDTCNLLGLFVGGTEYGVCYDGLGGC